MLWSLQSVACTVLCPETLETARRADLVLWQLGRISSYEVTGRCVRLLRLYYTSIGRELESMKGLFFHEGLGVQSLLNLLAASVTIAHELLGPSGHTELPSKPSWMKTQAPYRQRLDVERDWTASPSLETLVTRQQSSIESMVLLFIPSY